MLKPILCCLMLLFFHGKFLVKMICFLLVKVVMIVRIVNVFLSFLDKYSAAAALVGIPSAIVSNFTFDAVYSGLCEGDELDDTIKRLVEHVIKDYRNSELLIRLPGYIPIPSFSGTQLYPDNTITSSSLTSSKGEKTLYNEEKSVNYLSDINSFFSSPNTSKFLKYHRNVIDVPLVVRKSITPKEIVLKNLGIPKEIFTTHKILMVSFGGQNLVGIEDWGTSSLPDNWIAIVCGSDGINLPDRFYSCPKNAYIPDLTNAADAIIGKLVSILVRYK